MTMLTNKVNRDWDWYSNVVSGFLHPLCQGMVDVSLFAAVSLLWTHCNDSQKMRIRRLKPTYLDESLHVIDRREKIYRALYTLSIDVDAWIDDIFTNHGPILTQGDLITAIYWTLCHKRLPIVEKRKALEDEVAKIMLQLADAPPQDTRTKKRKHFSDAVGQHVADVFKFLEHVLGPLEELDPTLSHFQRNVKASLLKVVSETMIETHDGQLVSLQQAYCM